MKINKWKRKWFTLIELIIVMTILSIIWSFSYLKFWNNEVENYLSEYQSQVISRIEDLYKKVLIWINWHYNNKWIVDVEYIKLYCDEINKTFHAYVCDNSNNKSPEFNNCKQVDFPTLSNIEYGTFLSKYTKNNIRINHCMYLEEWTNLYSNWSFYIKINTIFPNWKIIAYKENPSNTKENESDDTKIDNIKINVKNWTIVKEFFPIYFK